MPWVNLDDQFFNNHKTMQLSKDAKLLYLAALCYCNANLTDGFVSSGATSSIAGQNRIKPAAVKELVDVGMWHKRGDGFDVHDYLTFQRPAALIKEERAKARDRMQRVRATRRGSGRTDPERSPEQQDEQPTNVRQVFGRDTPRSSPNPKPKPLKHSSRSYSPLLAAAGFENEIEMPKAEALCLRVESMIDRAKPEDVASFVAWSGASLDLSFVDQAVGTCGELADKPRSVSYLATTVRQRAAQAGVEMDAWKR